MKRIFLSPPHTSALERHLLLEAFDSNWVAPLGPHVDAFEREFAAAVRMPHAVALSSGTAALHLALKEVGVHSGDAVLTATLTFAATANAVTYVGATPAFIDCDRASWTMSPGLLEEELAVRATVGKLPKAVISVDLYGQCCDYDGIEEVCARYGVALIEDAAEALGAEYKDRPAGSFGRCAAFSFNGNKIITTSGGGMLVSNDKTLIARSRFLSTQARDPAPHYEHSEVGFNYRMSNLLAALGRGQLANLQERLAQRRANNEFYRRMLGSIPGIEFMPEAAYGRSNCWLTCITVDPRKVGVDREQIRLHLESLDIEARPVWKPMHLQPAFSGCRVRGGSVAAELFERGLCLPSGSAMTDHDRARVLTAILTTPGLRVDPSALVQLQFQ